MKKKLYIPFVALLVSLLGVRFYVHSTDNIDANNYIRVHIKFSKSSKYTEYFSYEPIFVDVEVENISKNVFKQFYYWQANTDSYTFQVTSSSIGVVPSSAFARAVREKSKKNTKVFSGSFSLRSNPDLQPGEIYSVRIPLQRYVDLSSVGTSNIQVQLNVSGVRSNKIYTATRAELFDLSDRQILLVVEKEMKKQGKKSMSLKK